MGTPPFDLRNFDDLEHAAHHVFGGHFFGFGLVFETPVLIVLLGLLDIVTVEALSSSRRYVVVAIVAIAAVATPSPDPISQLALAVPVYVMYELAILIIRAVKGKRGGSAGRKAVSFSMALAPSAFSCRISQRALMDIPSMCVMRGTAALPRFPSPT